VSLHFHVYELWQVMPPFSCNDISARYRALVGVMIKAQKLAQEVPIQSSALETRQGPWGQGYRIRVKPIYV
jgi:hypothetical protein